MRVIVNKGKTREARATWTQGGSILPNIISEMKWIQKGFSSTEVKLSFSCESTVLAMRLIIAGKTRKEIVEEVTQHNTLRIAPLKDINARVSVAYHVLPFILKDWADNHEIKAKELKQVFKYRKSGTLTIRKGQDAAREYVLKIDKTGVVQGHQPERCWTAHIVPDGLEVVLLENEIHYLIDKYPNIARFEPDPLNDGKVLFRYFGPDKDLKKKDGKPIKISKIRAKAVNKELKDYNEKILDKKTPTIVNSSQSQGGDLYESTNLGRVNEPSQSEGYSGKRILDITGAIDSVDDPRKNSPIAIS